MRPTLNNGPAEVQLACGGIAQLGERLHGMQEVSGSIPLTSTTGLCTVNKLLWHLLVVREKLF